MNKKLIYLMFFPPNKRDFERFGVDFFLNKKWNVEILVFSKFLNKNYFNDLVKNKIIINKKFIKIFNSEKDALVYLNGIEKYNYYIDVLVINNNFSNKIKKIVKLKKGSLIKLANSEIPMPIINYRENIFRAFARNIYSNLYFLKKKYFNNKIDTNYYIIGGKKSLNNLKFKKNKIIAHSNNFNIILKNKKLSSAKKFITYIDQSTFYTPELFLGNDKYYGYSKVKKEDFYKSINFFLEFLSKKYNLKVKVLGHHNLGRNIDILKSNYNFEVILGKSHEYIKLSKLVIGHFSYALEFAIYEKKPILFCVTNQQKQMFTYKRTKAIAKSLEKKVFNLDEIKKIDFTDIFKVNYKKYNKYIDNYIKINNTPELNTWEILYNNLKEIKDLK